MRSALAILAWAVALSTPAVSLAAEPQLYPRAEQGAVMLIVDAPRGLDAPITVRPGDVAWTQAARPAQAVRLIDALPKRVRPAGKPLPAGEILFGYRVMGGMAYCPQLPYQGARTVQCLRDIDSNGTFDACYIGDTRGARSRFMVLLVADLIGCGRYRFEAATWSAQDSVPASLTFKAYRDGVAVFRFKLEDQVLDEDRACEPVDDGACSIMGMRLRIEPLGDAIRVTKLSAPDEVRFETYMGGGLGMHQLTSGRRQ